MVALSGGNIDFGTEKLVVFREVVSIERWSTWRGFCKHEKEVFFPFLAKVV